MLSVRGQKLKRCGIEKKYLTSVLDFDIIYYKLEKEMFKIYTSTGICLQYSPRSYDTACRVAHYVRELGLDCGVVSDGRFVSEVVSVDVAKDRYALSVARRLL